MRSGDLWGHNVAVAAGDVVYSNPDVAWVPGTVYDYRVTATPGSYGIEISTDGGVVDAFTIADDPLAADFLGTGRFGFYSNSQSGVSFTANRSEITAQQEYLYQVGVADPDDDPLTVELVEAPSGMIYDATAGELRWWPGTTDVGPHPVTLEVTDPEGASARQSYVVTVLDAGPIFVTEPRVRALTGIPYSYAAAAIDPADAPLTYSLAEGPDGLTVDASSGRVVWSPTAAQLGTATVRLVASNGSVTGEQSFEIEVESSPPNSAPTITSTPSTSGAAGREYLYQPVVDDADGDALLFALLDAPPGMAMRDGVNIRWTPSRAQLGDHRVLLEIDDNVHPPVVQEWAISVAESATNTAPTLTGLVDRVVLLGDTWTETLTAQDGDGDTLTFSLDLGPAGLSLDGGVLTFIPQPDQLGVQQVQISVQDGQGGSDQVAFALTVAPANENRPPLITSTPPTGLTAGDRYEYQLRAVDPDGDPVEWELQFSNLSGESLSSDGLLAGTVPLNGLVRVWALDGRGGGSEQRFTISGEPTDNRPPEITSTPRTIVVAGETYDYSPTATDPDGDAVSFSLGQRPKGMTVDASSGRIAWEVGPAGNYVIAVVADDANGGSEEQTWTLVVVDPSDNLAPYFISAPPLTGQVGVPWTYIAAASDPELGAVRYALTSGPDGLSVDPQSGEVSWVPDSDAVGQVTVTITATDSLSASRSQRFVVAIADESGNLAPTIASAPITRIDSGEDYTYALDVVDGDDDTFSFELAVAPEGMAVSDVGVITWSPQVPGEYPVTVVARDGRGAEATQSWLLSVADIGPLDRWICATTTGANPTRTTRLGVPQAASFGSSLAAATSAGDDDSQIDALDRAAPADADLAPTIDAQQSEAITTLAQSLGGADAIFNWVYNNVDFVPSHGSLQGASYTLETQRGGPQDQASLLVALLRSADIPARFVYGRVRLDIDDAMNLTNVRDPYAAQLLMSAGGIPSTLLQTNGRPTHLDFDHVWVEAWDDAELWVPLDPSVKPYDATVGAALDAPLSFDPADFETAILATAQRQGDDSIQNLDVDQIATTAADLDRQIDAYIEAQLPGATVGEIFGERSILERSGPPPTRAAYQVLDAAASATVPDELRHRFRFELTDTVGSPVFTFERPVPDIAGRTMALSFGPETERDAAALESFLIDEIETTGAIPTTWPTNLFNVTGTYSLDSDVVAEGGSFRLGTSLGLRKGFWTPGAGWSLVDSPVVAGQYSAVGIDLHGASAAHLGRVNGAVASLDTAVAANEYEGLDRDDLTGPLLQAGLATFFGATLHDSTEAARVADVAYHRQPSHGTFSTTVDVDYRFGVPHEVTFRGVTMDIDSLAYNSNSKSNCWSDWVSFNEAVGLRLSIYEALIPEVLFRPNEAPGTTAVSAVQALAQAGEEGQRIWVVRDSNVDEALAAIDVGAAVESDIRRAAFAGKHVLVSEAPVTRGGWTGVGYIIEDPLDGSGAYRISGGANGGELIIDAEFDNELFLAKEFGVIAPIGPALAEVMEELAKSDFDDAAEAAQEAIGFIDRALYTDDFQQPVDEVQYEVLFFIRSNLDSASRLLEAADRFKGAPKLIVRNAMVAFMVAYVIGPWTGLLANQWDG